MHSTRWSRQVRFLGIPCGLTFITTKTTENLSLPCNSFTGVSTIFDAKRFASSKLARIYTMELNKVRSDYRRTPTKAQREECLRLLLETPLHRIQGLDGRTVAHCLSTLVVLDAPADLGLLHDCAVWISVHPGALPPHALAQSLYALVCLEYPDTPSVVRAVQGQALAAVSATGEDSMAPSSLCMLLSAVLTACSPAEVAVQGRGGPLDLSRKLSDRVLRAVDEGLGLTEKVMVAVALGKLFTYTTNSNNFSQISILDNSTQGFISEHVLSHLSGAVWSSISGAELGVISLPDLVGLISAIHTAPISIREITETALFKELRTRIETQPLVSSKSSILVARVLKYLVNRSNNNNNNNNNSDLAKELQDKIVTAIEAHIGTDVITLNTATKLLAEFSTIDLESITIPPTLIRYLVQAINEGKEKWDSESVYIVLRVFSKDEKLRADAQALATLRIDYIQANCKAGAPVDASEIAALLVEGIVDPHAEILASAVSNNISRWSVSNVLTFLRAAADANGKPTRAIMRDVASKLVPYIEKSTASQVAAVMSSYGRARVRNDAFCNAVTNRAVLLSSELTLQQISIILGGLAAVEYRDTKLFIDLAPLVIAQAPTADAIQTSNLLAAYSKMLIWNFKVIWSLAERAVIIYDQFSLQQIFAVVMSLNRMDVQHQTLIQILFKKVIDDTSKNENLSISESVMILSAFSRCSTWDATFFENLGKRIVRDQQQLTPDELAETLMSFARIGLTKYNIFEHLTLRALAVAPTSPLMVLSHIAVAFALIGCRHEELFSIIADRFVNQKADVPAVTIASVLSAFASVGIRNDRLFIESIPRVRHVGQYGTPKDITNVVYAYAQVGLWHYKLFVRLADRAIQLRGEFRCDHLARLLEAYARVDMRYEKLFVEFSPRVQTISHLLTAGEICKILDAYAKVRIPDTALFNACGDRAMEVLDSFEEDEAKSILTAFIQCNIDHDGLNAAFTRRFPEVMKELYKMEKDKGGEGKEEENTTISSVDVKNSLIKDETTKVTEKELEREIGASVSSG